MEESHGVEMCHWAQFLTQFQPNRERHSSESTEFAWEEMGTANQAEMNLLKHHSITESKELQAPTCCPVQWSKSSCYDLQLLGFQ